MLCKSAIMYEDCQEGEECREQKRCLCPNAPPFRRLRHSVFDALSVGSLGEASLDCLAPLMVGCGDLVEW